MSTTGVLNEPLAATVEEMSVPLPPTTVDSVDVDTYNTILGLNALKNSTTAAPPIQAPESSNGSSSLSELDDDENLEPTSYFRNTVPAEEENDSEAETERLHQSPHKLNANSVFRRTESGLKHHESINDVSEDDGMDIELLHTSKAGMKAAEAGIPDLTMDGPVTSPTALAGTKRKRLGDGLDATFMEPLKKRPSVGGRLALTDISTKTSEEEDHRASPASSDISDVSVRSYPSTSEEEQATSGEGSVVLKQSTEKLDELISEKAITKDEDHHDLVEPEIEEEEEEEGDEEAEASVKGEDEMAKKLKALADLAPIEKLFNIFRDKLHEERLAALDAELSLLHDPNCIHPEFLAQRQCIDTRRDERIQLEQVTARLKQECLERKVVAVRSQIHCQYFQEARQIREDCVTQLNEMYCKIQAERPQTKSKEPHFIYNLPAKRSQRIAFQTAYNKEVSVLSGIARHIGFPAAPEIVGARPSEMEEDLRAMGLR